MPSFRTIVPTPGTPVQIQASGNARTVIFQGDPENTGTVTFGDDNSIDGTTGNLRGITLRPGRMIRLVETDSKGIQLPTYFVDAANANDVIIGYYERIF